MTVDECSLTLNTQQLYCYKEGRSGGNSNKALKLNLVIHQVMSLEQEKGTGTRTTDLTIATLLTPRTQLLSTRAH